MAKKEKAFSIESVGKVDGTEIFTILEEAERLQTKIHSDTTVSLKKYDGLIKKGFLSARTAKNSKRAGYQNMTDYFIIKLIAELRYEIALLKKEQASANKKISELENRPTVIYRSNSRNL